MGTGDIDPDEFDYVLQNTDEEYPFGQKSSLDSIDDAWYFSEEQLASVTTVSSYERDLGDHPHEEIVFSLPTKNDRDPSEISLFLDEYGIVLEYETNIDSAPVLQVIKEEYPIQWGDELWIEDDTAFDIVDSARDVTGEVFSVELYNQDPGFNLLWNDMSQFDSSDPKAPFHFELGYDDFRPSIRNNVMDPLATFMPVVLRSDIASKDVGRFIRDLTRVIDMPSKTGEPLTRFMTNEEVGELADRAAKGYDTFR